jgi:hypothetical protein
MVYRTRAASPPPVIVPSASASSGAGCAHAAGASADGQDNVLRGELFAFGFGGELDAMCAQQLAGADFVLHFVLAK